MTQLHDPVRRDDVAPSKGWSGWVMFAATLLAIVGSLNAIQGLVALFDEGYFVVPTDDELLLVDFTAWGVVMLIWGALQVAAGLSLSSGKGWARWFAIILASLSILLQIGFLSAYPIWSTILIALDVFVIFALTVHWREARAAL
jgi:hypothetical protein